MREEWELERERESNKQTRLSREQKISLFLSAMEALVMFDPQNYPILVHFNDDFRINLTNLAVKFNLMDFRNLSGRSVGNFEENSSNVEKFELKSHEITDLVSLIFSPFIASIRVLKGTNFSGNLLSQEVKNTRITREEVKTAIFRLNFCPFFVYFSAKFWAIFCLIYAVFY